MSEPVLLLNPGHLVPLRLSCLVLSGLNSYKYRTSIVLRYSLGLSEELPVCPFRKLKGYLYIRGFLVPYPGVNRQVESLVIHGIRPQVGCKQLIYLIQLVPYLSTNQSLVRPTLLLVFIVLHFVP